MASESRSLVERFWQTMETNDFTAVGALFADGFVLEWPQTRELIRGRENFASVNAAYPAAGRWHFEVQRIVADTESAVSDVIVTDGARVDHAITFFDIDTSDGLITRIVEFWPEAGEPAEWRSGLVERLP